MGDEEERDVKKYVYEGARADGELTSITAGEEPKVLTKELPLLGPRSGEGTATFPSGDVYTGGFLDGMRSGQGTYTYAASPPAEEGEDPKPPIATYEGKYKEGKRHGLGILTFASGCKYHGCFKDGKYDGNGTMYYANGDIYTGDWVAGRKHGQGTYFYKETGAKLTATWNANVAQKGSFTDKWGNEYSGGFVADKTSSLYAAGGTFALCSGASAPVDEKAATHARLDMITAGHHAEISALFKALDADGDGSLDGEELRAALSEYMGVSPERFDAAAMMKAFDTHGTPDGKIDERELRWYLADWALCFADELDEGGELMGAIGALPDIISEFMDIVEKNKQ